MELSPELQTAQAWSKSPSVWLNLILGLLILTTSCDDGGQVLPGASGQSSELVLIMDDTHWEGEAGQAVIDALQAPFPSLPQIEAKFSVIRRAPNNLSYNLRTHRNLIIADIENNQRNVKTRAARSANKWSKGQVVYTLHALQEDSFIAKFNELSETIIKDIRAEDRKRSQTYVRSVVHPTINSKLEEKLGLGVTVHREFKLHELRSDFAWMTREHIQFLSGVAHDVIQGVAIYTQPYVSDSLFTPSNLMANRNEKLRKDIISSYDEPMTIETLLPPTYEVIDFKGHYAVEGRGLWRMERPIMGGPFVSISVIDEENARVITIDGYVFAPKFDKRNYLLDVEAILYSLQF